MTHPDLSPEQRQWFEAAAALIDVERRLHQILIHRHHAARPTLAMPAGDWPTQPPFGRYAPVVWTGGAP